MLWILAVGATFSVAITELTMGVFSEILGIVIAAVILCVGFPLVVKLFFALGPIGFCILAIGILMAGSILEKR